MASKEETKQVGIESLMDDQKRLIVHLEQVMDKCHFKILKDVRDRHNNQSVFWCLQAINDFAKKDPFYEKVVAHWNLQLVITLINLYANETVSILLDGMCHDEVYEIITWLCSFAFIGVTPDEYLDVQWMGMTIREIYDETSDEARKESILLKMNELLGLKPGDKYYVTNNAHRRAAYGVKLSTDVEEKKMKEEVEVKLGFNTQKEEDLMSNTFVVVQDYTELSSDTDDEIISRNVSNDQSGNAIIMEERVIKKLDNPIISPLDLEKAAVFDSVSNVEVSIRQVSDENDEEKKQFVADITYDNLDDEIRTDGRERNEKRREENINGPGLKECVGSLRETNVFIMGDERKMSCCPVDKKVTCRHYYRSYVEQFNSYNCTGLPGVKSWSKLKPVLSISSEECFGDYVNLTIDDEWIGCACKPRHGSRDDESPGHIIGDDFCYNPGALECSISRRNPFTLGELGRDADKIIVSGPKIDGYNCINTRWSTSDRKKNKNTNRINVVLCNIQYKSNCVVVVYETVKKKFHFIQHARSTYGPVQTIELLINDLDSLNLLTHESFGCEFPSHEVEQVLYYLYDEYCTHKHFLGSKFDRSTHYVYNFETHYADHCYTERYAISRPFAIGNDYFKALREKFKSPVFLGHLLRYLFRKFDRYAKTGGNAFNDWVLKDCWKDHITDTPSFSFNGSEHS